MQTSVLAQDEVSSPAQLRRKPLPTVPALLVRLILACLMPTLIGAGILIYLEYEHGRKQQHENIVLSVRDKLDAVDAKLEQSELFARTLAISGLLNRQDLSRFQQLTQNLLRDSNLKLSVILYDIDGQQLLNSNTPFGKSLPKRQDLVQIQSVFATGKLIPATVISRTSDGHPMVGIMVPVFSGSQVVYALAVGFNPQNLNQLLAPQHLPPGAFAAIIDSKGIIAGRSHEAEKYIGQKAPPEFLKQIDTHSEGTFELATDKDMPIQATFKSSPQSGWTVGIAIPKHRIETPLTHDLLMLSLGGALLLALILLSASLVGKRIAMSLRALHAAAVALGAGTLTSLPVDVLHETHELSLALQNSASRLLRRTQQLEVANNSLQERSTELNEAQHIAQIGNWKWDAGTGEVFVSNELLAIYGNKILRPFKELRGTVFPEEAWQKIKAGARETVQTPAVFSLLAPTLNAAGDPIWTRIHGERVCNAAGEVTGLRGTLQNFEAHVQAQIAIQDSAKRYRTLFDGSPEAIVVHWNGVITVANTSAVRLFAAEAEADLTGKPLSQFVHPDFQKSVTKRFLKITQLGDSVPPFELKLTTLKGQNFSAQVRSAELTIEGHLHIQTHIHDLTERKRQSAEIAHLQREMQNMLVWQVAQHTVAALGHEINQPLASASILCEAANRMLRSQAQTYEARTIQAQRLANTLQSIASDIDRAGRVLRNLLKSVQQPDITRASVMVNDMLAESIHSAREEGVYNYPITIEDAADLPTVHVNRVQVVKVLLNLIHNAAQAMQEAKIDNGTIWINTTLTPDGREVCISVKDEGPGVSATLQQEIFQPFITTKSSGLGMGLTISVALIEAQGGKLWHTQEGGRGAAFHFTLPISV